jgi:hypothetical protein
MRLLLLWCCVVTGALASYADMAQVVAHGLTDERLRTLLTMTEPFAADDTLKGKLAYHFLERAIVHHTQPTCRAFVLAVQDVLDDMRVWKKPYEPPANLPHYPSLCEGLGPVDSNSARVLRLARAVFTH